MAVALVARLSAGLVEWGRGSTSSYTSLGNPVNVYYRGYGHTSPVVCSYYFPSRSPTAYSLSFESRSV